MKKILILAVISLVLFSSGCIELPWFSSKVISGRGIAVNYFEPDFTELESGDVFDIIMEVQNTGGSTATSIYAYLYGISPGEWQLTTQGVSVGSLKPPDDYVGLPGEIEVVSWENLIAPDLPEGMVYTYIPRARVTYKYASVATTTITALTRDEYLRLKQKDQVPKEQPTTTLSKGPLGISISARAPVILNTAKDKIRLVITVDNLGNGNVFDPDYVVDKPVDIPTEDSSGKKILDIIEIKINSPVGESTSGSCSALGTYVEEDMRRGRTMAYSCEVEPNTDIVTRMDIPVTVSLRYGYFDDFATSLRVAGTSVIGGA